MRTGAKASHRSILLSAPLPPPGLHHLPGAPQRKRVGGNPVRDHASRPDVAALSNLNRRHQRRVAADKSPVADGCPMLLLAVVIAGDRARANVDALANLRITEVSKVLALRPISEMGLLQLDEIPDARIMSHMRIHPQAREGTHLRRAIHP